jgi:AraC family transcriptional regulator
MKPDTRSFYHQVVERVVDHLRTHLDDAPELGALASMANLSPYHFHRIFRGMAGETALEMLRRLRLERAAWRLRTSQASVTMIAFEAGFETHEAFTRAFRASFGAPPSEFRRLPNGQVILAAPSGVHFRVGQEFDPFIPLETGVSTMPLAIEQFPATRLATVRHRGPYNQIGAAFGRLSAIAGPAGLFAQPDALVVAIYHDDPESKAIEELQSDAAVSIGDGVPMPDGLHESTIPAGRYACWTHIGPFEGLGDAWTRFMGQAIPAESLRVAPGPAFEVYRSDMRTTPKEQLRTDLYVPIE